MPLGGFCEVCGRWVWINAYGECQFGHPASTVRDVQQLHAADRDDPDLPTVDAARSFALRPASGVAAWRYSLWLPLTFAFGLLSWLAFVSIGLRARRIEWIVAGLIYAIPPILVLAFWGTAVFWPLVAVELTTWVVSMMHAILVRDQYRAAMTGGHAGNLPAPPDGRLELTELVLPKGLDRDAARTLLEAEATIEAMAAGGRRIASAEVREKVDALARTAQRILLELRDEPRRLSLARGFLSYYLGAAERIVAGYADLTARAVSSREAADVLARAVATLDTLQRAFERELVTLALSDVIDLDAEISLLETTARVEGVQADRS